METNERWIIVGEYSQSLKSFITVPACTLKRMSFKTDL